MEAENNMVVYWTMQLLCYVEVIDHTKIYFYFPVSYHASNSIKIYKIILRKEVFYKYKNKTRCTSFAEIYKKIKDMFYKYDNGIWLYIYKIYFNNYNNDLRYLATKEIYKY